MDFKIQFSISSWNFFFVKCYVKLLMVMVSFRWTKYWIMKHIVLSSLYSIFPLGFPLVYMPNHQMGNHVGQLICPYYQPNGKVKFLCTPFCNASKRWQRLHWGMVSWEQSMLDEIKWKILYTNKCWLLQVFINQQTMFSEFRKARLTISISSPTLC